MPHQHTRNAWKYHSRADSQLTLITGKKFDPAPLESDIAASQHLADALVFGNGKPYPGVLLFRSSESAKLSDAELLNLTWSAIDKLNADSQSHTRISKSMAVPMPYTDEPLEKSSKGTVLRASAEKKFAVVIEEAYSSGTNGELKEIPDEEVPHFISETVGMAAPGRAPPDEETDLFAHGLDSVACMQLRGHIRRLLPDSESGLPLSIVEDCGTVRRLSEYVLQRRHGETMTKGDDEIEIMHKLAQQYSQFDKSVKLTNGDAVNGSTAEKLGDVLVSN